MPLKAGVIQITAMTAFTNQFEKRDPLTFNAVGIWDLWPRQTAWEARSLLEGRTTEQLTQIAEKVESVVDEQVAFMRTQLLAAMASDAERKVSEALYEAEALRRQVVSSKSRDAVNVRHDKNKAHHVQALRLANSKYFPKRAAAARYAADRVEKTPGETYTVGVVDGWLKAAGWRPSGEVPTA